MADLLKRVTLLLLFLLFSKPNPTSADCGSLVTYRQHADLLKSAPQCLRDGCRQEEGNDTISTPCPSTSACSAYWNMFVEEFDQSHSWCSTCHSDVACRISGWPVMNATSLCRSTPDQLLFGDGQDGCCAQNNEPFELAAWTGSMCNGSEWRKQFEICGGMACLDWHDWIMPWNWTVQNKTRPLNDQKCTSPSNYLALYAGEHFFWLLTTFGVGWFRLKIARHEEAKKRSIARYLLLKGWTGLRFWQKRGEVRGMKMAEGEDLRPPITDKLRWGFPIIMGMFLAGMQLGFNFWAAHLIKKAPGYEDVPLALLALLFCCRPRLTWLSCLLALIPKSKLVQVFKFKPNGDGLWAAKMVLSSVAVTSAVTEAILQLLGAYFLGRTAQVGAQKGFYYVHHLRPKTWGRDARRMYLGALFWLMLCIPLLIAFIFIGIFFTQVFNAVSGFRRGLFKFLNPKKKKVPKVVQGPYQTLLNTINPEPTPPGLSNPPMSQNPYTNQPAPYKQDQPFMSTSNDLLDLPMPYGGPATSSLFEDQPFPVREHYRRTPYAPVNQNDFVDQPMMVPRAVPGGPRVASGGSRIASGGHAQHAVGVQRRTPSGGQYSSLPQADDTDTIEPYSGLVTASLRSPSGQQIPPRNQDASHTSLLDPQTQHNNPPSSSGNGSSNQRDDYTDSVKLKRGHWEWKIIVSGAVLGMLAYSSQWVFWDGFVKTSGTRFCPPSLWEIGGLWWSASVLYVGLPFSA